jgi:2-keto-3-deoxygluconate permease
MVIVPLTLGALIGTFAPGTAGFFGSFTGALFTAAPPILAVFYVCMGATIPFETLSQVAGKGGVLLAAKVLLGVATALIMGHFLGTEPIKTGLLAGLSTLAVGQPSYCPGRNAATWLGS